MPACRRVSVVVITRDRAAEAVRAVSELRALPEQPPVVVVDNGSTDDTVALLGPCSPACRCWKPAASPEVEALLPASGARFSIEGVQFSLRKPAGLDGGGPGTSPAPTTPHLTPIGGCFHDRNLRKIGPGMVPGLRAGGPDGRPRHALRRTMAPLPYLRRGPPYRRGTPRSLGSGCPPHPPGIINGRLFPSLTSWSRRCTPQEEALFSKTRRGGEFWRKDPRSSGEHPSRHHPGGAAGWSARRGPQPECRRRRRRGRGRCCSPPAAGPATAGPPAPAGPAAPPATTTTPPWSSVSTPHHVAARAGSGEIG